MNDPVDERPICPICGVNTYVIAIGQHHNNGNIALCWHDTTTKTHTFPIHWDTPLKIPILWASTFRGGFCLTSWPPYIYGHLLDDTQTALEYGEVTLSARHQNDIPTLFRIAARYVEIR